MISCLTKIQPTLAEKAIAGFLCRISSDKNIQALTMEQINLLCETKNCEETARVFGMSGPLKIKSCEKHFSSLLSKTAQFFDISGYNFISSLQDAAIYEERKILKDKGFGNLTVLESSCECELSAALRAIEAAKDQVTQSVDNRFEEMKAAVTLACTDAKKQLASLYSELEQLLVSKENTLSPTAEAVCKEMGVTPMFLRFSIADAADSVSFLLSNCWAMCASDIHATLRCLDANQKTAAIESALAEATHYAQKGLPEALQFANLLIGGEAPFDKEADKVLSELLVFEKQRMDENLKWLQRSWEVRQRFVLSDQTTVEVGHKLARILSRQFSRFSDAEEVLRNCYNPTHSSAPEDSISLCNDFCEVYLTSAHYEKAEELGAWVLETFSTAGLPAEHYWTTLLYYTLSLRLQSKNNEANVLLEKWQTRKFEGESTLAIMLKDLTCGIGADYSDNKAEAEKLLLQARNIGLNHFPTSTFTALALSHLPRVCKETTREQYHRQAQSIFEVAAPKSILAAMNLNNLGAFLQEKGQLFAAEECYRQAQSIYETVAPNSVDAAITLNNLGLLLKAARRWKEAGNYLRQARAIYDIAAPHSASAANNLNNLGLSYKGERCWSEAEECHRLAQTIYEAVAPTSVEAANNLNNLGALLKGGRRWAESEVFHRQAESIYDIASPKSVDAGHNFFNMGMLFKAMKQTEKAIECFEKASLIYAENGSTDWIIEAEKNISRLKRLIS